MAAQNKNLGKARKEKNDEFYTQLVDIENEMQHYESHFKNKVIYCNCDDPSVSNFYHYFSHRFNGLKLKKLITTYYKSQERDLFSKHDSEKAISLQYDGFKKGAVMPDINDIGVRYLDGDGDFRSTESIALLKQADIVSTNPPFSLFREYIAQLIEYDKKFIIVGNMNALTYKETFQLIKANKVWLGNSLPKEFKQPNGEIKKFGNVLWFTNLDIRKRHEDLILYKKYMPGEYPNYDNYDAINVNKVKDIPKDYVGVMGVPISFLDKYNPDQFEIVGIANSGRWIGYECLTIINGRRIYNRILIKNKTLLKGKHYEN